MFWGIAITGDMVPTTAFGCTVMLRSEGLQITDLHQSRLSFVTPVCYRSGNDQGMLDFILKYVLDGISGCNYRFDQR